MLSALAAGLCGAEIVPPTSNYEASAGKYPVETAKYGWVDQKRNRKVPVKIYFPKTGEGPFPIIIFSHGLGGSREGYGYLGRSWASHGYVSVHLQHLGSDDAVWKEAPPGERMKAMQKSALHIQNSIDRPQDVTFAIDQVAKLNQEEGPFRKRLDLDHVGMAGHSFGSYTTLAIIGEIFPTLTGGERSATDPRVKAAIAMSSPAPRAKSQYDAAFAKIGVPCFHMTGTKDDSPIGDTKAEARRVPFDHINGADQFLVTFKDGDHMIFSGRPAGAGNREKDGTFQNLIQAGSTAFWDAYLKNDAGAKAWLVGNGFETVLGGEGRFEKKLSDRPVKTK